MQDKCNEPCIDALSVADDEKLMIRDEEKAFVAAIRKARKIQEIHAALELLPLPPGDSTKATPATSEEPWLAILQERTTNTLEN